ncbi:MAG: SigE family RNA polymerase sigma factor [Nocardiopsaceae bacterium]|nr:SigE family RNA polymerase sigma factor [Nocardiopsaceae bacterium]
MDAEAEGFAQFIEARQLALQRTAWLLTNDWALAQDLVQTALARSWPYWGRIRRRDDPEIYVRRVMVNTWSTWGRRKWRAERPSGELSDRPASGDLAGDVATRLAVRSLLAVLTDRQRAVVVLRLFDDLSEAQVAQILGCAAGTVKATMSQAMARLRRHPQLADLMERRAR